MAYSENPNYEHVTIGDQWIRGVGGSSHWSDLNPYL
jgi:hypothetical protein